MLVDKGICGKSFNNSGNKEGNQTGFKKVG